MSFLQRKSVIAGRVEVETSTSAMATGTGTAMIQRRKTSTDEVSSLSPVEKTAAKKSPSTQKSVIYAMLIAVVIVLVVSDPRTWYVDVTPAVTTDDAAKNGNVRTGAAINTKPTKASEENIENKVKSSAKPVVPAVMISKPFVDNRFVKRSLEDYHDLCVVGAGLSGTVIAERYANMRNQTSLIIERRTHIAGNCFDYIDDETGIRVSKYGAHLFHTYYKRVWDYVQKFSDWTKYEHEVLALVNGKHVPVPVNIDTVNALFGLDIKNEAEMDDWLKKEQVQFKDPQNSEEMALSRVGKRLYELIFHPYTIKQWAKEPKELGPAVTARIPVRNNHDGRYFADPHQALPTNGYTAIFTKMMDNPLITVKTDTDFFEVRDRLHCGKVYYTGPIDRYFTDLGWKKLEYRSLDFERKVVKDIGFFQPKGVVNHPNATTNFTRIVEYKHFLNQTSNHTILFYEYSNDGGEPYYPVPNPENEDLFKKYQEMAGKEHGVTFAGRLANYKYFNMDQTIENALSLFEMDTQSMDLVISYCEGDDLNWVKKWQDKVKFNQTYVYAACKKEPPKVVEAEIVKLAEGADPIAYHMLRNDVDFGSQSIFVEGTTMLTVDVLEMSLLGIQNESVFVDFVGLPFESCKVNACDRNVDAGVHEFYVTHEAMKRFVSVNREELQKRAAA